MSYNPEVERPLEDRVGDVYRLMDHRAMQNLPSTWLIRRIRHVLDGKLTADQIIGTFDTEAQSGG